MNEGLIPRRYAKALYEFATEKGDSESIYGIMTTLVKSFSAENALQSAMANPFVDNDDKVKLLMTAAGATQQDATFNDFVALLKNNARLDMARGIAMAYLDIYRKANNIYLVEVVTAAPLAADDEQRLKNIINSHLNGGTMEYASRIDSNLIGGFVIKIGSELLDASVSNELKQLRLKLLSN
jgi:F-type H+-transporting ATPase subunit delta